MMGAIHSSLGGSPLTSLIPKTPGAILPTYKNEHSGPASGRGR